MSAAFSQTTLAVLHAAGWSEDRQVETRGWAEELREGEFEAFPAALEFLASFGGLDLEHPGGRNLDVHFKVSECLDFDADPIAVAYPRRVGASLMCPIGESHGGNMILAITPDGRVYAGVQQNLIKIGDSGREAIERLMADGPFERIP